jgi:hypothetical protein
MNLKHPKKDRKRTGEVSLLELSLQFKKLILTKDGNRSERNPAYLAPPRDRSPRLDRGHGIPTHFLAHKQQVPPPHTRYPFQCTEPILFLDDVFCSRVVGRETANLTAWLSFTAPTWAGITYECRIFVYAPPPPPPGGEGGLRKIRYLSPSCDQN